MKFAILDSRPIPAAKEANEKIFAEGSVFGIEVTIPELAKRCVGNIDPQHTDRDATKAAIEVAFEQIKNNGLLDEKARSFSYVSHPLDENACEYKLCPPSGDITLVTVRPDLDSIGAMAIFSLDAEGVDLTPAISRIKLIAESDKFAKGGWPGIRALPTDGKPFDDSTASTESDSRLAPMSAVVSDFKLLVYERVELLKKWLLTGEEPAGYRERWIAERVALAKAITDGSINTEVAIGGKVVGVISTHRAATSVGYCLAPVVVALNPSFKLGVGEPHKKFTICQFASGYIDLKAILAELSGFEAGWGGSPTIGGSPQGVSSTLTIDEVVSVVKKHLTRSRSCQCGSNQPWESCNAASSYCG